MAVKDSSTEGRIPENPATEAKLARLGDEFLERILGRELERRPENLEAVAERAHALTRLGRTAEGLELDRQLARACPEDPIVHYNLACSLALLGRIQPALRELVEAVELGFDDPDHLEEDVDLESLRCEPTFRDLVRQLRLASA